MTKRNSRYCITDSLNCKNKTDLPYGQVLILSVKGKKRNEHSKSETPSKGHKPATQERTIFQKSFHNDRRFLFFGSFSDNKMGWRQEKDDHPKGQENDDTGNEKHLKKPSFFGNESANGGAQTH